MNALTPILTGETCCEPPKQCESPSILDTLRRKQRDLSTRLADVTAAIDAMEKNPEAGKVPELVARAR